MERHTLKNLDSIFKQLANDVKKCRAGLGTLQNLAAFDGDGAAMTIVARELESISDQLAKDTRIFAKQVQDLAASIGSPSDPALHETSPNVKQRREQA